MTGANRTSFRPPVRKVAFGKIKPQGHRIGVFGPGGIGKTTLAATAPGPVGFIDLDDSLPILLPSLGELDIRRVAGITGWDTNIHELMMVGERGVTMARAFNLLCGLGRKDDRLPLRMNTYFKSGKVNEEPIDPEVLEENLSVFYGMMGWDPETGVPTRGKLDELDIAWVGDLL